MKAPFDRFPFDTACGLVRTGFDTLRCSGRTGLLLSIRCATSFDTLRYFLRYGLRPTQDER
jgi:hypothetical protein